VKPPKVMEFVHFANKKYVQVANPLPKENSEAFSLEPIFVVIYNISRNLLNKVALYFKT